MSEQKAAENREVVIEAKNLGVKFHTGNRTDDYKSFALRFIKREKDPNAGEAFWPLRDLSFKGTKEKFSVLSVPTVPVKRPSVKCFPAYLKKMKESLR
jgi:hypothetical protein